MTRLSRVSPAGVPVHVIQRGNNRQDCFVSDEDYGAYLNWLKEYSSKVSGGHSCLGDDDQPCSFALYSQV